uniref:Single-stranded DNA-binding protein 3-like n=1 Tax=Sphaeramia orbicularis TaxID=375764 RepID=A0A672Y3C1_9TELE
MYAKGKGAVVPSDSQAREKLALYVYEYLLHVGAQKSAQTFLSEIRWEKNITLGEPPGFLHSWWCVFWDLYCAAPDRRETCEHSSEAKAFHDYSAAAAPSPVMGNMPPNDGMPGGPMPPGFFQGPPGSQPSPHTQPPPHNPSNPMMGPHGQPPGSIPGSQPLLPNSLDPTRPQGHPNMGGPMRMNPPRGMGGMGPQNYGGGMRPPPNSMGPGMPGSGDMDGLPKNSPNNMAGMNNPPGTPRDDGEMAGNFLNPFQSESVSTKTKKKNHLFNS